MWSWHKKADCETHWRDFVNRFSMDDFPDLRPPAHLLSDNSEPENETETNVKNTHKHRNGKWS